MVLLILVLLERVLRQVEHQLVLHFQRHYLLLVQLLVHQLHLQVHFLLPVELHQWQHLGLMPLLQ